MSYEVYPSPGRRISRSGITVPGGRNLRHIGVEGEPLFPHAACAPSPVMTRPGQVPASFRRKPDLCPGQGSVNIQVYVNTLTLMPSVNMNARDAIKYILV
jgi:hypothetical protein